MDFSLTREQKMLKKLAAQFAEQELEPVAAQVDEEHTFPVENFAKMAKVGFTGIGVPKEYGGCGGGVYCPRRTVERRRVRLQAVLHDKQGA